MRTLGLLRGPERPKFVLHLRQRLLPPSLEAGGLLLKLRGHLFARVLQRGNDRPKLSGGISVGRRWRYLYLHLSR